ncbi:metallophosphoesterase [Paenibacillus aurantiacus]|uniref:Metallophosphoesterase n=1 Tax=Paenibacillus aurantiacus TaxID=1936118 RepID=A0ABV5KZI0_9BACL
MAGRRKLTRRQFMKWIAGIGLFSAVGTPLYSFGLERNWLEVTSVPLRLEGTGDASLLQGLRLVHFSDTHYGFYWGREQFDQLAQRINRLKPDLICFTGDLVDSVPEDLMSCLPIFQSLDAPYGKFAILGNHDSRNEVNQVVDFWAKSGFKLLINESVVIEREGRRFFVAGTDDYLNGSPDLPLTLSNTREDDTVIMLIHEPDIADVCAISYPQVKLQLSGHSHGGQIRLPFISALATPPAGKKYVSGLYRLGDRKMPLYTTRGIGTTGLPIRLFCRPELTVIDFV